MGFLYEFNWILKLPQIDPEISIGKVYNFAKSGIRIYPIGTPVELVNDKWEVIARCIINSITITQNMTEGEYIIIELYSKSKQIVLTEQLKVFSK